MQIHTTSKRARLNASQRAAADRLLEYARSVPAGSPDYGYFVKMLQNLSPLVDSIPEIDVAGTIWHHVGHVIEAEGSSLVGADKPGWAAEVLRKAEVFRKISDHYDAYIFDEVVDRVTPLDRDLPEWNEIVRRNITLPRGLIYEVEAVRRRLAEGDAKRKVSFSALLEIAVKALLARPVDKDDARFYDEDFGLCFDPDPDDRFISQLVEDSGAGARRTAPPTSGEAKP